jgi:zinc and cadmium transporter
MSSNYILVIYAATAAIASLAGGAFPSFFRLTHTRMHATLSFIAGLMLGMSLLHMVPHAAEELHSVERAMVCAAGGFLAMFFLQRVFQYHQHGTPEAAAGHASMHGMDSQHSHSPNPDIKVKTTTTGQVSWVASGLGLGFHSLLDGLALAAAVSAEAHFGAGMVGLGTAVAVIMHKPFDSLAVVTLMESGGCSPKSRRLANFVIALIAPLGMGLAFLGLSGASESGHFQLGCAMGFCAGSFLCVACSDLLPELHFHAHNRWQLSLALLAGVGVSILVGQFEHSGHEHETVIHLHNQNHTIP